MLRYEYNQKKIRVCSGRANAAAPDLCLRGSKRRGEAWTLMAQLLGMQSIEGLAGNLVRRALSEHVHDDLRDEDARGK